MRIGGLARIVAVDPAYGYAVTGDSIPRLPPVHFVTLGGAEHVWQAVDIGPGGSDLVSRVPGASRTVIDPAWHFSFLGLCTAEGPALLEAEGEDPICDDPAGSDRAAVHARIVEDIAAVLGLVGTRGSGRPPPRFANVVYAADARPMPDRNQTGSRPFPDPEFPAFPMG